MGAGRTRAKRLDPELWEQAKVMACTKYGLCDHSARKMQRAVQIYKNELGGRYAGEKRSDNGLVMWTKEKWKTRSGRVSKGKLRYLPSKVWDKLSPKQARATQRLKDEAFQAGKQYVRNTDAVREAKRRAMGEIHGSAKKDGRARSPARAKSPTAGRTRTGASPRTSAHRRGRRRSPTTNRVGTGEKKGR